ncbi:hypothetical protein E2542_SST27086 [Spatholobus suberectus]|nr:hypothetical protein E2542_SST27086 [Spatholobus suberectus]
MATLFCVSNPISHPSAFASLRTPPFFNSPPLRVPAGGRKRRGSAVAARAGPSLNSVLFAIALPSSLLAVTVLAALRMGDKLDREWLEEVARNEASMELDEYDDDDDHNNDDGSGEEDSMETFVQEEPALSHARNRPKREA